ncbi:MAG: alpha/beta fold hydrolase [Acidimicrobiia bacterium]|nr:alpha/beta fold hydrolase [Acidimicrobiia bacterium]
MTMLTTSDGIELAARSWSASGEPRASVVLVHGLAATKDNPELVAVATALADRGFEVLTYDARGHGESGGICTLGDLERYDVAAAVARAELSGLPVVVVGASMGGIAVLRHAADDPSLAGVVTVSSPADWRLHGSPGTILLAGMIRTRLGRAFAARLFRVRLSPHWTYPESPRALAGRVTSPLAVVHGERDHFIPTREATGLFSASGGERRLFLVPRMGHAFHPEAVPVICEAVDWALAASAVPSPA